MSLWFYKPNWPLALAATAQAAIKLIVIRHEQEVVMARLRHSPGRSTASPQSTSILRAATGT